MSLFGSSGLSPLPPTSYLNLPLAPFSLQETTPAIRDASEGAAGEAGGRSTKAKATAKEGWQDKNGGTQGVINASVIPLSSFIRVNKSNTKMLIQTSWLMYFSEHNKAEAVFGRRLGLLLGANLINIDLTGGKENDKKSDEPTNTAVTLGEMAAGGISI